jgi:hypothetical protein
VYGLLFSLLFLVPLVSLVCIPAMIDKDRTRSDGFLIGHVPTALTDCYDDGENGGGGWGT